MGKIVFTPIYRWQWCTASYTMLSDSLWSRRSGCLSLRWKSVTKDVDKCDSTQIWFKPYRWILGEVKWGGAGLRGIVSEPQGNAVEERQEYGLGGDGRLGMEDTLLVLYTDLQFLIDAMVEAVVFVVIFAFVQRIVFHVLGKGSLHLVYIYTCKIHLRSPSVNVNQLLTFLNCVDAGSSHGKRVSGTNNPIFVQHLF